MTRPSENSLDTGEQQVVRKAILLTTDFSNLAQQAYPHAAYMAKRLGLPLRLIYVVDRTIHFNPGEIAAHEAWVWNVVQTFRQRLEDTAAVLTERFGVETQAYVLPGRIVADILAEATANAAMIVTASHGYSGHRSLFLGSTASALVQLSPIPVLVIKEKTPPRSVEHALFATNLDEVSRRALDQFIPLARTLGLSAEVLYVEAEPTLLAMVRKEAALMPPTGGRAARLKWIREQLAGMTEQLTNAGIKNTSLVEPAARAAPLICSRAVETDADVIVVASHGRGKLSKAWMGSVADEVLRRADRPVLVLKPV